jgi:GGDEF domain-containing protein
MLGRRKKDSLVIEEAPTDFANLELDPETQLMGPVRFEETLQKEIARGLRYGSRSALALFEVGVAERPHGGPLPSPAPFVAHVLRKATRETDFVARVTPTLFAVLLIEAQEDGAKQFTERVRTSIGSHPYARGADGGGLFARAWAGVASWEPAFDSVGAYAGAAETALARTYRGYEAQQDWFRGEGVNKPFTA